MKNLERRYSRLFFALLLLGFLAQYVNDFFIAREAGNPCAFRGPLGCDVLTYHQLQDEAGVGVALIGLVLLLAYEFVPLAYRFVFRRALLSPGRAVEQNT